MPPGYMTFRDSGEQTEGLCHRDVTSPINELDGQSNNSRGEKLSYECSVASEKHNRNKPCSSSLWKCNFNTFSVAVADDSPFFDNDMPTMRSSSSSSESLPHVIGLNWEGSLASNEVNTEIPLLWRQTLDFCLLMRCDRQMCLCPPGLRPVQKEQLSPSN